MERRNVPVMQRRNVAIGKMIFQTAEENSALGLASDCSISYNMLDREIHIRTNSGRLCRPLLTVSHKDEVKNKKQTKIEPKDPMSMNVDKNIDKQDNINAEKKSIVTESRNKLNMDALTLKNLFVTMNSLPQDLSGIIKVYNIENAKKDVMKKLGKIPYKGKHHCIAEKWQYFSTVQHIFITSFLCFFVI